MFYRIDSVFIELVEMINGSVIQWKQLLKCCLNILALQGNLLFKTIFVIAWQENSPNVNIFCRCPKSKHGTCYLYMLQPTL